MPIRIPKKAKSPPPPKANKVLAKSFLSKATSKAKAELKANIAKSKTKAKTAIAPASKQKFVASVKAAKEAEVILNFPGLFARCRAAVSGDWRAALLLYRIAYLWKVITPKLERFGQNWIAMTRADWAMSAGLTPSELEKFALTRLKMYGAHIVEIRAMGNSKNKKVWVNFDPIAFSEAVGVAGYELKVAAEDDVSLHDQSPVIKQPKPKKSGNSKNA